MQSTVDTDPRPGAVLLGRYRLEKVVGRGGMGVVWAASDLETGEARAIKWVHASRVSDASSHERLIREARAAASVRHPNVARVFEVCELDDGRPFIVMELLIGESLATRLRRKGALSVGETCRVLGDVCGAVKAAHERGIIHRDLKPDNVFLERRGDEERTKVLDFGLAKRLVSDEAEASLTSTGGIIGTPHYMAPEQIFGDADVDERADAWALGIMLHECLTGHRPTRGSGLGQVLKTITTGSIPALECGEPALVDLTSRLLRVPREERPGLDEVARVLARHAGAPEAVADEPPPPSSPTLDTGEIRLTESIDPITSKKLRPRRRPRSLRGVAVALGAVVVAAVGIGVSTRRAPAPAAPIEVPAQASATTPPTTTQPPETTAPPTSTTNAPPPASAQRPRVSAGLDAGRASIHDAAPEAAAPAANARDAGFDLPLANVRY